jgi:D-alanine-D-alanine ligase
MSDSKPYIIVLYNHAGEDVYEKLKDVDPASLDFEPEYDIEVTTVLEEYNAVVRGLRHLGYRARGVNIAEDVRKLERVLKRSKPDVVFNLVEHFRDDPELEAHVAAMFEVYGVAYTGATPFALSLCQKKGLTKDILLGAGVPTPRFRTAHEADIDADHGLRYPIMVKPAREDASSGVAKDSVVNDLEGLQARVAYVFEEWGGPVLIEEFIDGRELHVGVLGNDPPEVLPPIEWDFSGLPEGYPRLISYAAKWNPLAEVYHQVHAVCPAAISDELLERVEEVVVRAFEVTECRDYARLDIRIGPDDVPYVLEVNPNPDLTEGVSFMEAAEVAGYGFEETLSAIVEYALERKTTTQPEVTSEPPLKTGVDPANISPKEPSAENAQTPPPNPNAESPDHA